MKVLVLGLGNFGMSLAISLIESGNEVIGVDSKIEKVELVKDKLTHAVVIDSTHEASYQHLPLKDVEIAIVAIGENEGPAILTTAVLKKLGIPRIISRSLSPLHDTVLEAMGISEIVHPEQDSAERLSHMLNLDSVIDRFELDDDYSVSEIKASETLIGQSLAELNLSQVFKVNLVTIMREVQKKNFLGSTRTKKESIGVPTGETRIQEGDILVVFGKDLDISKLCSC